MSIFKTKGVVLKCDKIGDKDLLYTIFTSDFGKIRANKKYSKKEKSIDIGNLIDFEIHTKENVKIHKIKNIKISGEFNINKDKNFSQINIFLEILANILRNYPDGLANNEIFEILENIIDLNLDETKLILSKLKIRSKIGYLGLDHENNIIEKILKFITNSDISNILKLTGINEELKKELNLI